MADSNPKIRQLAEKSFFSKVGDFLAPGKVTQADPSEYKKSDDTQYDRDMKLPLSERLKKVQKGFTGE